MQTILRVLDWPFDTMFRVYLRVWCWSRLIPYEKVMLMISTIAMLECKRDAQSDWESK